MGQKPGHHHQLLSFCHIAHPEHQQMFLAILSKCIWNPTITLYLHCPHPGPAPILSLLDYLGSSSLVSPLPPLPPFSTRGQRDPVRTSVKYATPLFSPILRMKHQLLSIAWPQLPLRPHLPPLFSGSPCSHHTGLFTVPLPCAGHTPTSGPLHILSPVPGTLPIDTYIVHYLI